MSESAQNLSLQKFVAVTSDYLSNDREKRGKIVPEETLSSLLSSFLTTIVDVQNAYLCEFSKPEYKDFILSLTTKPKKEYRDKFLHLARVPETWKGSVNLTRSCISEAISKLKGYFKRFQIAELLEKNPEMSYREMRKHIPYLKLNLYKNVKRAGSYPKVPYVTIPKIYLGIDGNIRSSFLYNGIIVNKVYIKETTLDLLFPVSESVLKQYPHAIKIGVPTLRTNKNGDVIFDFKITSIVGSKKEKKNVLGVDPKMYGGFAGALVTKDGNISKEINPSSEVFRDEKKKAKLEEDIKRKKKRLENILRCTPESEKKKQKVKALEEEISQIRAKKHRINEHQDWNAANDLVLFSKEKGAKIALEDVTFNDGDNHWRNRMFCNKVEHIAKKYAVFLEKTNPKNTSRTCPQCGGKLDEKDLSERTSHCSHCGLELDRDYAAGIVHAKKAGAKPKNFNKPKHKKYINKKSFKKQKRKKSDKVKWRCLYWASSALSYASILLGSYKVRTRPDDFVCQREFLPVNTNLAFRGLS